jgi:hypothetical protein
MKPNKLDNQIREKLNTREIQPTAQAWDRLDAMLTVSEEKKSKKGNWVVFVAASTILFFGLGFFIFNTNKTQEIENSNPIVTTIKVEIDSDSTNEKEEISVENAKPVLVLNEVNNSKATRNIKSVEPKKLIKEENILEEKITPNSQLPTPNSQLPTSEKLLVEVQDIQNEIPSDKKNKANSKIKIDAASLLSTVEKEIHQTHKETTLDKLTKKFQEAKSAIVNRNYE